MCYPHALTSQAIHPKALTGSKGQPARETTRESKGTISRHLPDYHARFHDYIYEASSSSSISRFERCNSCVRRQPRSVSYYLAAEVQRSASRIPT